MSRRSNSAEYHGGNCETTRSHRACRQSRWSIGRLAGRRTDRRAAHPAARPGPDAGGAAVRQAGRRRRRSPGSADRQRRGLADRAGRGRFLVRVMGGEQDRLPPSDRTDSQGRRLGFRPPTAEPVRVDRFVRYYGSTPVADTLRPVLMDCGKTACFNVTGSNHSRSQFGMSSMWSGTCGRATRRYPAGPDSSADR